MNASKPMNVAKPANAAKPAPKNGTGVFGGIMSMFGSKPQAGGSRRNKKRSVSRKNKARRGTRRQRR